MSTKNVTEEIVQMTFDNQAFERNIKQSQRSIQELRDSMNMDGSAQALSIMQNSIDKLTSRFSALGIAGMTAIQNITNKAIEMAEQFTRSFAIGPFNQGFGEYELKMGSVQTIMASTGASLEEINGYLEELNNYADKTIYSFSDMTSNIGKFTNAGVDLKTAVKAIQGVSNAAALAGANSNEASRAMYNIAQSLSGGFMKYIDWMSIKNANMATKQFKQALIDMGVEMGTLVKVGEKYQTVTTNNAGKTSDLFDAVTNFDDSLQHQWLTTKVLMGTLERYSDVNDEIGEKASKAATEVKTFTQLIGTIQEAIGSGWAQTFELFIGDFEEAKELFTNISDVVGGFIDKISKARNNFLEAVLGEQVAPTLEAIGDGVSTVTTTFEKYKSIAQEIIHGDWGDGEERIRRLTEAGYNYAAAQQIVNNELKGWAIDMSLYTDATNGAIDATEELTSVSSGKTGRELLIEILANSAHNVMEAFRALSEAFREIFPAPTVAQVQGLIRKFHAMSVEALMNEETFNSLKNVFKGVFSVIRLVMDAFGAVFPPVFKVLGGLGSIILNNVLGPLGEFVTKIASAVHESGFFYEVIKAISGIGKLVFYHVTEGFKNFATYIGLTSEKMQSFKDWVNNAVESFRVFLSSFKASSVVLTFRQYISKIPNVLIVIVDAVKKAVNWFKELFSSIAAKDYTKVLSSFGTIGDSIREAFGHLGEKIIEIKDRIKEFFSTFGSTDANDAEKKTSLFVKIGTKVRKIIEKLVGALKTLGSSLKKTFVSIKDSELLGKAFKTISNAALAAKEAIKGWFESIDISAIYEAIKDFVYMKVIPAIGALRDKLESVFNFIKNDVLGPAITKLKEWYDTLEGTNAIEKFKSAFDGSVFAKIPEWVQNAIEAIKEFYGSLDGENVFQKFKNAFITYIADPIMDNGIIEYLKPKIEAFYEWIKSIIEEIKTFLFGGDEKNKKSIVDQSQEMLNDIGQSIESLTGVKLDTVTLDSVSSFLTSASGTINSLTGGSIDTSAIDSISSFMTQADGLISSVAGTEVDFGSLDSISAFVSQASGAVEELSDGTIDTSVINDVQEAVEQVTNMASNLVGEDVDEKAASGFSAFVEKLKQGIDSVASAGTEDVNLKVMIGKVGEAIVKVEDIVLKALDAVDKFFGFVTQNAWTFPFILRFLSGIANLKIKSNLASFIGSLEASLPGASKKRDLSTKLLDIAKALGILAVVFVVLTKLPKDQLWDTIYIVTGVLAMLASFSAIFNYINKDKNSMYDVGKGILAIAGAMVILKMAVKSFGKMDTKVLIKGGLAVTAFLTIFGIFTKKMSGVDSSKTSAKAVLAFAASMVILSFAVEKLGKLNVGSLIKALASIIILMASFYVFTPSGEKVNGSAKAILAFAVAMLAMAFAVERLGGLDIVTIIKGLGTVIVGLLAMKLLMPKGEELKGTGINLMLVSAALVVFSIAIKKLGEMDVGTIIKSFVVIVVFFNAVKKLANNTLDLKSSSVGILAISAALYVMSKAVKTIAEVKAWGIAKAVTTIKMLMKAVTSITESSMDIKSAGATVIAVAGMLALVVAALYALSALGVSNILEDSLGLAAALWGLAQAVKVLEVFKDMSPVDAAKAGLSLMIVLGEFLAGALAVLGIGSALDQLTHGAVSDLIMDSLDFLEVIGDKIGHAIGSFIGSLAEGFADKLPDIGTKLTEFMTNISGFLTGAAGIDSNTADGISTLMSMLGELVKDEIWSAVADIIGSWAGDDHKDMLTKYSEGLKQFGDALIQFDDQMSKISVERVDQGVTFMERVGTMANSITDADYWLNDILGGRESLGEFGQELLAMGAALIGFSAQLILVNTSSLTKAADAMQALSDVANGLPEVGGIKAAFYGHKETWAEFAAGMPELGKALYGFAKEIKGDFDPSKITSAATAAGSLATLQTNLPMVDGWEQKLNGTTMSWSEFSEGMPELGEALRTFGEQVNQIPSVGFFKMNNAITIAGKINELALQLPKEGILQSIFGEQDLGTFSENIEAFSGAMKTFCQDAAEADYSSGDQLLSLTQSIIDIANQINDDTDGNVLGLAFETFVAQVGRLGKDAKESFEKGFIPDDDSIEENMTEFINKCLEGLYGGDIGEDSDGSNIARFRQAGVDMIYQFNGGVNSKQKDAQDRVLESIIDPVLKTIQSTENRFRAAGRVVINGFCFGIRLKDVQVHNQAISIVNTLINALSYAEDGAYNQGQWAAYGFCAGIASKRQQAYNQGWNLGIAALQGTADAQRSHSPSKEFAKLGGYAGEGYAVGMRKTFVDVAGSSKEMGLTALDAMQEIINRVNSILNGTEEFNPVITPVLDLTKVNEGVGVLGGLFGNPQMHLSIPGVDVLGDSVKATANVDIKDQVRQGVLEALKQNPVGVGDTNNFYIDGHDGNADEIADAVIDKLNLRYNQRRAVFG